MISIDKITLNELEKGKWVFLFPENEPHLQEDICKAYDELEFGDDEKAQELFKSIIQKNPYSIDAYTGLAHILREHDETEKALQLLKRALALVYEAIPKGFKDQIPGSFRNNHQFLFLLKELGETFIDLHMLEDARNIFLLSLQMNPHDDLEVGSLLNRIEKIINDKKDREIE